MKIFWRIVWKFELLDTNLYMNYLEIIKENGHSITWVAKKIGTERSYLSKSLHGHIKMTERVSSGLKKLYNM